MNLSSAAALCAGLALLLLPTPAEAAVTARIVSPAADRPVYGKSSIETTVQAPEGVTPLKVEVFVDGRLLATLLDQPFQTPWDAGDGADPHLIRVKVYASDGSITAAEIRTAPRLGVQRARVLLVEVYVTVKDEDGGFITDLRQDQFTIQEDGRPQKTVLFTTERKPIQVVLLLDVSASMKREDRLVKAVEAARAFVEALEPKDSVAVLAFSDETKVLQPFTLEREPLLAAIGATEPQRGTSLYDAIHVAAATLGEQEGRRALILLSDGQDLSYDGIGPGSTHTFEEAVTETLRQQVTAYTIGLGEQLESDYDFDRRHSAKEVLTRLAEDTGGRFFPVSRPGRLRGAFERVLDELRFQYLLGYNPSNDRRDGTWRSIAVSVSRPRVKVSARKGYFAPTD